MESNRILPITRPCFDQGEIEMVKKCLDSGWVTQGPMTAEFEALFAKRHRVQHAFAVTSCTTALHLAVLALGIGPGDEVIVPSFTWITTANCVEYVGAKAVFVDVDPHTFNIDPQKIEAVVTEKTKVIIPVHLFGLAAPMREIREIANKHGLFIIEDAACAIGTTYDGVPVGTLGEVGCFSFHPRKSITTGEGGLACTNDEQLASRIAQLRNHGAKKPSQPQKPYDAGIYDMLGYNFRLSDIQAAVGIAQFAKLDRLLEERLQCALYYLDCLEGKEEIICPPRSGVCGHTYQAFVVRVESKQRRDTIIDRFTENGIQSRFGTMAVHRAAYYAEKYGIRPEDFPASALCEDCTITLPLYPGMVKEEQDFVVQVLTE